MPKKKAVDVYALALANDCYRWSCSTFFAWTFFALAFQRDFLYGRYGAEGVIFSCTGAVQTVFSYAGDVYYLQLNQAFWPDIVLATTLVSWAVRLHHAEWAFRASIAVSGAFFGSAIYLNHAKKHPKWWYCHIGWHMLPLELYLTLTPVAFGGLDRALVWTYVWALVVLAVGGVAAFARTTEAHDAHAVLASAAVLAAGFRDDPYPLSVAALTFSAGYFLVDLFCCLRERDWMFAGHHAATLLLVGACLREPPPTLVLGARALLVELSTPLLHHWQKRDTAATFALFLAAFFAARCCYLPLLTLEILRRVSDARAAVLVALNALQFAWFGKFVHMYLTGASYASSKPAWIKTGVAAAPESPAAPAARKPRARAPAADAAPTPRRSSRLAAKAR